MVYVYAATVYQSWNATAGFAFAIDHERCTCSQMVMTDGGVSPVDIHSARFLDGGGMKDVFRLFRERLAAASAVPMAAK
mgnify:CR=1 FL=1